LKHSPSFVRSFVVAACAAAVTPACARTSVAPPPAAVAAPPATSASAGPPAKATGDESGAAVPIDAADATWGSRTAPVTVVEFADFECPFCAHVEPTLARLRVKYGPERLRFVWKHDPLPFHPNARPAAEAAAGVLALAGSDAFWRFHDSLLFGQGQLGEASFVTWAQAAGVRDTAPFRAGLRTAQWAPVIDANLDEAKRVGANGTPTFFVNGVRLVGAQPEANFVSAIDAQLLAAENKISSGVAAERLYGELAKDNFKAAEDDDDADDDTKTVYKVPLGTSPVRGGAQARVTIVEFTDYQCPYCKRAEATLQALAARYGGKIRLVVKNEPLPFHEHAEPAAEALLEVRAEKGDAAFWAMHDALFEHQDRLKDELVTLAERAGANADLVRSAIAKHRYAAQIQADEDLADDLHADGTPHFFVDGRRIAGAQPVEKFAPIIDEELKKADALVAAGTKPEALYDALTAQGQGPAEAERRDVAGIPANDPARGAASARVVVHEFADFQCPFCERVEPTLAQIAKDYQGRVKIVWHDLPLPFHENALPAARAAREARAEKGDAAFWDLHDRFLTPGAKLSRADLDAVSQSWKLDPKRWSAALDSGTDDGPIGADRDAAVALGMTGTPSFLIAGAGAAQGYLIVGAESYAKFRRAIERALAEAK
jgi:protein-disulfide isomerase